VNTRMLKANERVRKSGASSLKIISLITGLGFLLAAVYPKPIILEVREKPHPYQVLVRLCLAAWLLV